tara:strand:+ start:1468 stop:2202 length:735 start_codon:yes stop_codon:yes gene_type:complete
MANTQTTVPLFVANQVLTAAQQNTSAGTGVPVFATTVTRDAAFGGSNKALAEGQLCYIEASNVVQYYDGAAWATVGPSSAAGLVCVKAKTAFSAVATITVDGIFTTAYTNYKILMTYTSSTGATQDLQLRVGGVTASAADYTYQSVQGNSTSITGARTAAGSFVVGSANGAFNSSCDINLYSPFVAAGTNISTSIIYSAGAYTVPISVDYRGSHSLATAYDGFILTMSGTCTGSYTIYGYGITA